MTSRKRAQLLAFCTTLCLAASAGAYLVAGGCSSNQPYKLDKELFGFEATFVSEPLSEDRPVWQTKFNGLSGSNLLLEVRPENYADLDEFRKLDLTVTIVGSGGYVDNTWGGVIGKHWTESEGGTGSRFHQYRRHASVSPFVTSTLCVKIHPPYNGFSGKRVIVIIRDPSK